MNKKLHVVGYSVLLSSMNVDCPFSTKIYFLLTSLDKVHILFIKKGLKIEEDTNKLLVPEAISLF